ncbi:hypothetical protein ACSQ5K_09080 [Pseudomonas sp. PhalM4]
MSFTPGVSLEQRQAVKLASLWAETVTLQDMAKEPQQEQYDYYRKKLMYLGWTRRLLKKSIGRTRSGPELSIKR